MINNQSLVQEKIILEDLLEIKKQIDQLDLLEFKAQWDRHVENYANLDHFDRLKFTIMSIKILQAKIDLLRTISSIKECSVHPEPKRALYYYLQANLWKFLDNFHYILLTDDISDYVKLNCIDLLDELTEIIAQDEQLQLSCLNRLQKLLTHIRILENEGRLQKHGIPASQIYKQLDQRVSHLIDALRPSVQVQETSFPGSNSNPYLFLPFSNSDFY